MSAAGKWVAERRDDDPDTVTIEPLRPDEPRPVRDLDKAQEVAWAIVGAILYLSGALAGGGMLVLFGGTPAWVAVGCLWVMLAGALPAGYSMVKAAERRLAAENHDRLTASRETTRGPGIPIQTFE